MNFNLNNSAGSGTGFTFGGGEANKPAFGAPVNNDKKPFNFTNIATTSAAPAFGSGLMFGSPTTSANTASGSLFSSPSATSSLFGTAPSNPTFGGFGATGTAPTFGQTPQAQVTATQQGGLNLSFGATNTTAQPTLGFGQTVTTPATTSAGLSFGAPAGGGSFNFQTPSSGFSAAPQQPVAPAPAAAPAFNFGGASKGLSLGSTPTAGGLNFGSTATVATTAGLSFGTSTAAAGGVGFGTTISTPATGGLGASAFGAPSTASGGLTLGAPALASTSAATGLSFGTPTSAPAAGLSFGAGTTQSGLSFATTSAPATGLSFGTAAATTAGGLSFGTAPGLSFGTTATTAAAAINTTTASTIAPGISFGSSTPSLGFNFSTASSTAGGAGGLGVTSTVSAAPVVGLNFKTTAATTATVTTPSTGFQLGSKTPATGLSGFSLPTTSAAASTAASTAAASGITALGQATTTTAQTSLITATTTTAQPAPQPVSSLTFAQLEDNINKWTLQLEEQEKLFINQATQINAWDRLLIENGEKIVELNEAVQTATNEQQAVEHELEFIVAQQRELEDLLAPLERELAKEQKGREPEREHMYQLAETLDTQLKQMSEDLKEVIQHLNDTNRSQDGNDPIVQIGRILNAHMSSMQWVDNSIGQISTKLDQLKSTHDALRRDNERSFHLTYN